MYLAIYLRQWGTLTGTAGSHTDLTFPTSFTAVPYSVLATRNDGSTTATTWVKVNTVTKTGCTIVAGAYWIALGK